MDYKSLQFKCGLEIHQQLEGKKLFCNCPTTIKKGKSDFTFKRRLRASAGESGAIDKAAMFELKKSKEFEYHGFFDCCCLVELDEEPPRSINMDALNSALITAKLLNMKIVDKVQFMRKTVIDGSNVSGFQRTALIGYDGLINVNGKDVRIETLCLEEEAAQTIERGRNSDSYNISRLGIPLIEIATAPDISSADECRDVASYLGRILRSISNCKRGIGSIRQDVNVSIKNGNRVEIKGFQDVRKIPVVIENEIKRHVNLISKGKKVEKEVRKAEGDGSTSFLRPMPGADRMYPETDVEPVYTSKINVEVPETLDEKVIRYQKSFDLSKDLALKIVRQESKEDINFEELFNKHCSKNLSATNVADFFLSQVPNAKNKYKNDIKEKYLESILNGLSKGIVAYSSVQDLLKDASSDKLDLKKYEQLSDKDIEKIIKEVLKENEDAPMGLLMGKIMGKLKGRADGKKVKEILNSLNK